MKILIDYKIEMNEWKIEEEEIFIKKKSKKPILGKSFLFINEKKKSV